ncbi:MAG: hypothetical protein H8F28_02550 [Fibrella sp.]|nr:hypothetical protein [Armatimonadota bacterium]
MKPFVVGIDAGGTHVRVQYADAVTGRLVRETLGFRASASGEPPHGMDLPSHPVSSVCAGITKITRAGIAESWEQFLRTQFPDAHIAVVPDYVIAFHAALPEGNGVVIIAGTGSVAYGENGRTEKSARCGGRGWEWGDEGSGAWLTTEMVRRTLRALDEQASPTTLTRAVCEELGTMDAATLAAEARRRVNEDGGTGRGFLVPLLVRVKESGDGEAQGLFIGAGGWLASLATATANRLGFAGDESVTFATSGGVWKAGGKTLEQGFLQALKRRFHNPIPCFEEPSPIEGATRLAFKSQVKRSE